MYTEKLQLNEYMALAEQANCVHRPRTNQHNEYMTFDEQAKHVHRPRIDIMNASPSRNKLSVYTENVLPFSW